MTAAAVADSLGEFRVGEPVWCLARIGQPFEVVAVDDVHDRVSIRTRAGWPTVGQIDIFPETRFMITRLPGPFTSATGRTCCCAPPGRAAPGRRWRWWPSRC